MNALLEAAVSAGFSAYNAAAREFVSLEGFVALCEDIAGRHATVRLVGNGSTGTSSEVFDPLDCVFPFPNANYILDTQAIGDLGLVLPHTSIRDMVIAAMRALGDDPARRRWQRSAAEGQHL